MIGSVGSVNVSTATTLVPTDQIVAANAAGGAFPITLPPFAQWNARTIRIVKVDGKYNAVTWQTSSSSDVVVGFGTSGTLTAQGQEIEITVAITSTTPGRAVASTSGVNSGSGSSTRQHQTSRLQPSRPRMG